MCGLMRPDPIRRKAGRSKAEVRQSSFLGGAGASLRRRRLVLSALARRASRAAASGLGALLCSAFSAMGHRAGVRESGKLVPSGRIELPTSALPRMRSTTELRRPDLRKRPYSQPGTKGEAPISDACGKVLQQVMIVAWMSPRPPRPDPTCRRPCRIPLRRRKRPRQQGPRGWPRPCGITSDAERRRDARANRQSRATECHRTDGCRPFARAVVRAR